MKTTVSWYGSFLLGAVCFGILGWLILVPSIGGLVTFLLIILLLVIAIFGSRKKNSGKTAPAPTAVCIAALVASLGINEMNSTISRHIANGVCEEIIEYKVAHGSFPADIAAVNPPANATKKWGIRYDLDRSQPVLSYPSPWDYFFVWSYDFATREWVAVDL